MLLGGGLEVSQGSSKVLAQDNGLPAMKAMARITALLLAFGLIGCDQGWQEFERIRSGDTMPEKGLLRPENAASNPAAPAPTTITSYATADAADMLISQV